jgi:serine protease Do
MSRKSFNIVLACIGIAMAALSPQLRAELKPEDIYAAATPSIITLEVENLAHRHFVGCAFLTLGDGFAITAWHVIHDARRVEARFSDNQRVKVLGVVDKNETLDLALLKLENHSHPQIPLSSVTPRIGSRVYVVGSPRGLDFSISEGLLSQIRTVDGVRYYQLSCPISPGDSGGPVLNDRGEAIGVVSWRQSDAENVGFALPSPAVAGMNATLAPVAWLQSSPVPRQIAGSKDTTPLVRADVTATATAPTNTFHEFQQFLSGRAGHQVTVTVTEHGKETPFSFQVPSQVGK